MSSLHVGHRRSAILPTLIIAAALVVLFAIYTGIWTDRLWFGAVDFGSVFSTMLLTRVGLFAAFGVIMAAIVVANALIAYRIRPRFRSGAPTSQLLERYRELLDSRFTVVVIGVGVIVGLFGGGAAGSQVFTYLGWRNSTPFGTVDPRFNIDIGFFVFDYPWWRFVLGFLFTALLFGVVAAAIVHYITGGLRLAGIRQGGSLPAQAHLSILVGLAVLIKGVTYWFDQYGLAISNNYPIVTGFTYTTDTATATAKMILAIIAGLCALMFFANAVMRRWVIPTIGLTLLVLSAIVLGAVYPGAVQYFSVRPSEESRERTYIERNIAATRAAYGVDDVEIKDYSAKTAATAGQLRADAEALPGIRLIDPNVIGPAFEQLQQVRGYYAFPRKLDVDRYTIDGNETDVVVAARELNLEGVQDNWNNRHTVYTHGYGLVAAYSNKRQSGGQPDWIVKDIPPTGLIDEHEPRIYFGEIQGAGIGSHYSVVGAPDGAPAVELDTPGGGEGGNSTSYTYDGKGGVPIGNAWNRLLYAAKFADVNLLLSDRVNSASKIIYDRLPRERVQKVAPWLTVDADPYPAVVDGRVVWVVDGYTTSNSYPNSQRVGLDRATSDSNTVSGGTVAQLDTNVNYIRNSVKAVVDAYDGTVTLYAWDNEDPILKTWSKAFPGTIQPKESIPAGLLDHLRYPQDLFKVQRDILTRYHMTDASNWYRKTALWAIPNDPVNASANARETPYYLSIKWPGDDSPTFSLTTAYVPDQRSNLASYMAVNADAASPDYGKIRILRMSDTTQIDGPGQTFSAMVNNPAVAEKLRPYLNDGSSRASYGNLLTLPVGGGLLYVMPVYVQRAGSNGSYPALQYVIVRFGQSVGIGDTLQEALDVVFAGNAGAETGEEPTKPGEDPTEPPKPPGEVDNPAAAKAITEAQTAFAEADKALRGGDLATYQAKIAEAEAAIKRAQTALGG